MKNATYFIKIADRILAVLLIFAILPITIYQLLSKNKTNTDKTISLIATFLLVIFTSIFFYGEYYFMKKYVPIFQNGYIVSTPYQISIRETRHIVCDYMMDKEDIFKLARFDDSICLGAFPMDIHSPTGADMCFEEEILTDKCYEIPLRSILPVGLENVVVTGRCIGCTHEAAASVRVSPVAMALGEVGGTLCALAKQSRQELREVDYSLLKKVLEKNGALTKK